MATKPICKIDGCGKAVSSRGWCEMHYTRWKRHGDPLANFKTVKGEPRRFFREIVLTYKGDECLIWPYGRDGDGYARLYDPAYGNQKIVARLVCEEIHGPQPLDRPMARHICGMGHKGCVAPSHLVWATAKENSLDRLRHGTDCRGERSPNAKLEEADVRSIITLKGIEPGRSLARRFGVTPSLISRIHRRKAWAHLK